MKIFKEIQDENAKLKGMIKKYEGRLSEMAEAIAKLQHRLDYYENPHSPPSQNSIPTMKRKAEKRAGSGAPVQDRKAPGRRKGHAGVSHGRSPTRTERHYPKRCGRCGSM